MSLSDIMSGMRLHIFAEAALFLASLAFLGVLVTTFLRRNREPFERARLIPLQDDAWAPRPGVAESPMVEEESQ